MFGVIFGYPKTQAQFDAAYQVTHRVYAESRDILFALWDSAEDAQAHAQLLNESGLNAGVRNFGE